MEKNHRDYFLPVSIIIAALLISGAWIYTTGLKSSNIAQDKNGNQSAEAPGTSGTITIKPVDANDHIRGNPEAEIKIVEFSDLECPFCKRFHPTMAQILADYRDKVAWVYRHYPIASLHPKAGKSAEASECAGELGGNEKFWAYVDKYFEVTPSNNQIDLAELPKIAEDVGLNRPQFESCLASGKYSQKIKEHIQDGDNAGAQGTPYSVVIAKDGRKFPLNGALPYSQVKPLIEEAIR